MFNSIKSLFESDSFLNKLSLKHFLELVKFHTKVGSITYLARWACFSPLPEVKSSSKQNLGKGPRKVAPLVLGSGFRQRNHGLYSFRLVYIEWIQHPLTRMTRIPVSSCLASQEGFWLNQIGVLYPTAKDLRKSFQKVRPQ